MEGVGLSEAASKFLQLQQRSINCLADPDRATRRRALQRLSRAFFEDQTLTPGDATDLFVQHLSNPLLRLFQDQVEGCREGAIGMFSKCLERTPDTAARVFDKAVCEVAQRVGKTPFPEPSEEIRLRLVQLAIACVKLVRGSELVAQYLAELAQVTGACLADNFPDAKAESAQLLHLLCATCPDLMHLHIQAVLKPLLGNLSHQHSRVRRAALQSLCPLVLCAGEALDRVMADSVGPALRVLAFDRTASVRKERTAMLATWMLQLPQAASHDALLMPHLLGGLCDESPEVQQYALEQLLRVADARAASETAGDAAARSAAAAAVDHVAAGSMPIDLGVAAAAAAGSEDDGRMAVDVAEVVEDATEEEASKWQYPPPFSGRPSAALRQWAQRLLPRVLPPVLQDLTDWTVRARSYSAQLLEKVLAVAERRATAHLEPVLLALSRAIVDEEDGVVASVRSCAALLGQFVPPDALLAVALPQARGEVMSFDTPSRRASALAVLAACVQGMAHGHIGPHLAHVAATLSAPGMCDAEDATLQQQVAIAACNTTRTAVELAGGAAPPAEISLDLSRALLHLQTSALAAQAADSLQLLARAHEHDSVAALLGAQLPALLPHAVAGFEAWTKMAPPRRLFDALCRAAAPALAPAVPQLVQVFCATLDPARDADLRMAQLALLESLLGARELRGAFAPFAQELVERVVIPNATWRVGRVASTIRKVALACLYTMLEGGVLQQEHAQRAFPPARAVLVSCLDDDDAATRKLSCFVLAFFFGQLQGALDDMTVGDLYGELLKRLDDSSDAIRVAICSTLTEFLGTAPVERFRGTIADYTADCLFIHLDDTNVEVQDSVMAVLKRLAGMYPDVVAKKAREARERHRSPALCDELAAAAARTAAGAS